MRVGQIRELGAASISKIEARGWDWGESMGNRFSRSIVVVCLGCGLAGTVGASAHAQNEAAQAPSGTTAVSSASGNTAGAQATTGTTGSTGGAVGSQPTETPNLKAIVPAAPVVAPNQPLTLTGDHLKDVKTVAFVDPQNNRYDGRVISAEEERLVVISPLGFAGKWKVIAATQDGKTSALDFAVASVPAVSFLSPQFAAFVLCFLLASSLLLGVIRFSVKAVSKAEKAGWSLGEALSEESDFQPREINAKCDVIVYASTSRVIALIGLMGILSIVVGLGYAIMWNLTMFGTVPDLTEVRSFLYGAACLFAPYLANQLKGVVSGSGKTKPDAAASQAGGGIMGIAPDSPLANAAPQPVQITGSGFRANSRVTFIDPMMASHDVAAGDITAVASTLISVNATLYPPGRWKVAVADANSAASSEFAFKVFGPPTVNSAGPGALMHKADAQTVIFAGEGFMSGLSVQLTPPGGAAFAVIASQLTSQQVTVEVTLPAAGAWQVVITNPGNHASAQFTMNVG